jgi:hypothetical protein
MKRTSRILITIAVGIFLIIAFYSITNAITNFTGFAVSDKQNPDCLESKNINLYINSRDSSEVLRNLEARSILSKVKITNCYINQRLCSSNRVTGFPAWQIDGELFFGDLSEEKILELAGCY